MVSIIRRMRNLKAKTYAIRNGIGAALLPDHSASEAPPVSRIHLTYARKMYNGHIGARRFWRECLPRLKFHNPAIPITVKQIDDQNNPAYLTLYFNKHAFTKIPIDAEIKDKEAPAPMSSEKVSSLDIRNLQVKDIWARFRDLTGAADLKTAEIDLAEEEERQRFNAENEKMRQHNAALDKVRKQREALLQKAREDAQKLKEQ